MTEEDIINLLEDRGNHGKVMFIMEFFDGPLGKRYNYEINTYIFLGKDTKTSKHGFLAKQYWFLDLRCGEKHCISYDYPRLDNQDNLRFYKKNKSFPKNIINIEILT